MSQNNKNQNGGEIRPVDILKPKELATAITADQTEAGRRLVQLFGEDGLAALRQGHVDLAAKHLNRVIHSQVCLFPSDSSPSQKLRDGTIKAIRKASETGDPTKANQLYLEDTYPGLDHEEYWKEDEFKIGRDDFTVYAEKRRCKSGMKINFYLHYQTRLGSGKCKLDRREDAKREAKQVLDRLASSDDSSHVSPPSLLRLRELEQIEQAYKAHLAELDKVGLGNEAGLATVVRSAVRVAQQLGDHWTLEKFFTYCLDHLDVMVTQYSLKAAADHYRNYLLTAYAMKPDYLVHLLRNLDCFLEMMPAILNAKSAAEKRTADGWRMHEIDPIDIQNWLNKVATKWRYQRHNLDQIRGFFSYCFDTLRALPRAKTAAHSVSRPKPSNQEDIKPVRVFASHEAFLLLVNIPEQRAAICLALQLFAGLHATEIQRLVWDTDFIWERDELGQKTCCTQIIVQPRKGKVAAQGTKYVTVRGALAQLLQLAKNWTGMVCPPKRRMSGRIQDLARHLGLEWQPSICRHSTASHLLGLGESYDSVATHLRNTVAVLKRHYFAPVERAEAEKYFAPIADMAHFESLPIKRTLWQRPNGNNSAIWSKVGTPCWKISYPEGGNDASSVSPKRAASPHIDWPSREALLVAVWDRPLREIAQELGCRHPTLYRHLNRNKFPFPSRTYWHRKQLGLPNEIPKEVAAARQLVGPNPQLKLGGSSGPSMDEVLEPSPGVKEAA